MRLYHTGIFALLLVLSFGIDAWDLGDNRDVKILVDKSRTEQSACDLWAAAAKGLPGDKALGALKRYPGSPPATKALYKKLVDLPRDESLDVGLVSQAAQCRPPMVYDLAKKLIESSEFYLAAERKEIPSTLLKHIASELENPTTQLAILSQADLLRKMIEAKLVTLSKTQASQWQELGKLAAMNQDSRRERPSAKDFYRELESAERVRPRLLELVSSLR